MPSLIIFYVCILAKLWEKVNKKYRSTDGQVSVMGERDMVGLAPTMSRSPITLTYCEVSGRATESGMTSTSCP